MGKGFIFSIDQGTTGTRAFVLDIEGNIISSGSKVHNVYYPALDWVEHDPVEIYENVKFLLKYVTQLAKLNLGDIDVISITNQRATAVLWDRQTGKPLYNAIVWQCRRNSEFCNQLKKMNFEEVLRGKTGQIIDPSYAGIQYLAKLKRIFFLAQKYLFQEYWGMPMELFLANSVLVPGWQRLPLVQALPL